MTRVTYNGYIVYCVDHDQGAIIKLRATHDEDTEEALAYGLQYTTQKSDLIGQRICGCRKCNVKFHGLAIDEKILIGHSQKFYDMLAGGWKLSYFGEEMYKQDNFNSQQEQEILAGR